MEKYNFEKYPQRVMKCLFKYSVNTVLHSDIKRGQLGNKNRILYFRQDVKNVNISKVVYI